MTRRKRADDERLAIHEPGETQGGAPDGRPRTMPHSLEAERSVFGGVLIENKGYPQAAAILPHPRFFFRDAHRRIWRAMIQLDELNLPIDLVALKEQLAKNDDLDECGGPAYLASLVDGVPQSTNVQHYAAIVRDKSALRSLFRATTMIGAAALDADRPAEEILRFGEQTLFELANGHIPSKLKNLKQGVTNLYGELEFRMENKGAVTGVDTGFADVNKHTLGWQRGNLIFIGARPSIGKAQPLDAGVLTSDGRWKPIGQLRVGDEIASAGGGPQLVTGVFDQGVKPCYRVTFIDGRATTCCQEHLWRIYTSRLTQRDRLWTTTEVAKRLQSVRYRGRLGVPLINGEFGRDDDWPVDPWLLGFLIGDGTLHGSGLRFATADQQILDSVASRLPSGLKVTHVAKYDYSITTGARGGHHRTNAIMSALRGLGVWGMRAPQKRIPALYLTGSYATRLDLLRGLLDSDGWAQGSVCFSTTSEGLLHDVTRLARSIGAVARPRRSTRSGPRPSYEVVISHQNPVSLFTLHRKQRRARRNARREHLTITSVNPIGRRPTRCISVSDPSGLYVTDDYVVTHNTAFALNSAVAAARLGNKIAYFSMEMTREELEFRILSQLSGVGLTRILNGALGGAADNPNSDFAKINAAMEEMSDLPLWIDDQPARTFMDIRSSLRQLIAEDGCDEAVIDYVQLFRGSLGPRATRNEQLTDISGNLKALARELQIPIIVLSQIARRALYAPDPRPKISDLKDSGAFEQDADVVALLHRRKHEEDGPTEFILAKVRNGAPGSYVLTLVADVVTFVDGGVIDTPAPAPRPKKIAGKVRPPALPRANREDRADAGDVDDELGF